MLLIVPYQHPQLREKIVTEFAPQNNLLCLCLLNSIACLR